MNVSEDHYNEIKVTDIIDNKDILIKNYVKKFLTSTIANTYQLQSNNSNSPYPIITNYDNQPLSVSYM